MKIKTVIILILLVLLAIILVQNTKVIDIQLFFWKLSMSRIILIVVPLFIGFIIGLFVAKRVSIR